MVTFTAFTDRAQAAWACLGVLRHAERWAMRLLAQGVTSPQPTFATWEDVVREARRAPRLPHGVAEAWRYLQPKGHPDHLSFQHKGKGHESGNKHVLSVSLVIQHLAGRYFLPESPMALYLDAHPTEPFATDVSWLRRNILSPRKGSEPSRWFAQMLADAEQSEEASTGVRRHENCEHFLKPTFGKGIRFRDPDFPCLRAWEFESVATAFFNSMPGSSEPEWDRGLYAIVREARGPTVERGKGPADRNIMTRDLLWLGSERRGWYFSSYDERLYCVELTRSSGRTGTNLQISGTEIGADTGHPLHLSLPEPPGGSEPPTVLDAILTGTGSTRFDIAAWKVLLARPPSPWAQRLDTLLTFKGMHDPPDVKRILVSCRFARRLSKEESIPARMSFRRILMSHEIDHSVGRLAGELRSAFETALQEPLERAQTAYSAGAPFDPATTVQEILKSIDLVIQDRWFEIEPAQIVTFIKRDGQAPTDQDRPPVVDDVVSSDLLGSLLALPEALVDPYAAS